MPSTLVRRGSPEGARCARELVAGAAREARDYWSAIGRCASIRAHALPAAAASTFQQPRSVRSVGAAGLNLTMLGGGCPFSTTPTTTSTNHRSIALAAESCKEGSPAPDIDIPLDDADPAAWDAALAFLYPSSPMPRVTWDTALALLTVAHKYDVPSLTGARGEGGGMSLACRAALLADQKHDCCCFARAPAHAHVHTPRAERVVDFLTSPEGEGGGPRLAAQLTPDNAELWLGAASRCGLDGPARICIDFCVSRRVRLPGAAITALQPAHAEELLSGLLAQLAGLEPKARELGRVQAECSKLTEQLASYKADLADVNRTLGSAAVMAGGSCHSCRYAIFIKPKGKPARFCINCGAEL
jgi:hypothetical protein